MADSYEVLLGKYHRSLTSIKQLDQQNEILEKQMGEIREEQRVLEKNVRYLCMTILKKDRETKEKKSDVWANMSLLELVLMAQNSLEQYFPSLKQMIDTLMQYNRERGETIDMLRKELSEMGVTQETENPSKQAGNEKSGQKGNGRSNHEKKQNVGTDETQPVKFQEEKSDKLGDTLAKNVSAMQKATVKEGPVCQLTLETEKTMKKTVKHNLEVIGEDIKKQADALDETSRMIIKVLGETGKSVRTEIDQEIRERISGDEDEKNKHSHSITSINSRIVTLRGDINGGEDRNLIVSESCSVVGNPNFIVYKLTERGRLVYHYLFRKDPVEAEMDIILRQHTTLEHGYGIKRTAMMLQELECIKEKGSRVEYETRDQKHSVSLGDHRRYIPDIIIDTEIKGVMHHMYIEYETGKCLNEFWNKCNKMAQVTRYLYFIVPNQQIEHEYMKELEEWIKMITSSKDKFPGEKPLRIRMSTFYDLKTKSEEYLNWTYDKSVSVPKKA